MHTPEWYGTIGIMNGAHMHRRSVIGTLRNGIAGLCFALARVLQQRPSGRDRRRRAATSAPRRGRQVHLRAQHA